MQGSNTSPSQQADSSMLSAISAGSVISAGSPANSGAIQGTSNSTSSGAVTETPSGSQPALAILQGSNSSPDSVTSLGMLMNASQGIQTVSSISSGTSLGSNNFPGTTPGSSSLAVSLPGSSLQNGASLPGSDTLLMGTTGSNILQAPMPPSGLHIDSNIPSTQGTISSINLPATGILNSSNVLQLVTVDNNLPAFGIADGVYIPTLGTIPGLDLSGLLPPGVLPQVNLTTSGLSDFGGQGTSSEMVINVGQPGGTLMSTDMSTVGSVATIPGSGSSIIGSAEAVFGIGPGTVGSNLTLPGSSSQTTGPAGTIIVSNSSSVGPSESAPGVVALGPGGTISAISSPNVGSDGTGILSESGLSTVGPGVIFSNNSSLIVVSGGTGHINSSSIAEPTGTISSTDSSSVSSSGSIVLGSNGTILSNGPSLAGSDGTVLANVGPFGDTGSSNGQISGIINGGQQSTGGIFSTPSASEIPALGLMPGIVGQTTVSSLPNSGASELPASIIGLPINSPSIGLSTLSPLGSGALGSSVTTGTMSSMEIVTQPGSSLISSGNVTGILTGAIVSASQTQQPGSVSIMGNFVGTISAIVSQNGPAGSGSSMPVTGSFSGTFTTSEVVNLPTSGTVTGLIIGTVTGPAACFPTCAGATISGSIIGTLASNVHGGIISPSPLPSELGSLWTPGTPSVGSSGTGTTSGGKPLPGSVASSITSVPELSGSIPSTISTSTTTTASSSGSPSGGGLFIDIGSPLPVTEAVPSPTDPTMPQIDIGLEVNATVESFPLATFGGGVIAAENLALAIGADVAAVAAISGVASGTSSAVSSTSGDSTTTLFSSSLLTVFTTSNSYPSILGSRPCLTMQLPALWLDLRSISLTSVPHTLCFRFPPFF